MVPLGSKDRWPRCSRRPRETAPAKTGAGMGPAFWVWKRVVGKKLTKLRRRRPRVVDIEPKPPRILEVTKMKKPRVIEIRKIRKG
jgi:hypothetical protein